MNKVPIYEVKAPCRDASFEVASGNSAPNSPLANEQFNFSQTLLKLEENGSPLRGEEYLRCDESFGITNEQSEPTYAQSQSAVRVPAIVQERPAPKKLVKMKTEQMKLEALESDSSHELITYDELLAYRSDDEDVSLRQAPSRKKKRPSIRQQCEILVDDSTSPFKKRVQ